MNRLYETLQAIYETPDSIPIEPSPFYPVTVESEVLLSFRHRIRLAWWLITGRHLHAMTSMEVASNGFRNMETVISIPSDFEEEDYEEEYSG